MDKKRRERIDNRKKLAEWSKQVRERDGNKCVICRATKYIHAHHILPKEAKIYHFLRFDINNGITLCAKHHKYSYEISPHKNPLRFILWFQVSRPKQFNKLLQEDWKI